MPGETDFYISKMKISVLSLWVILHSPFLKAADQPGIKAGTMIHLDLKGVPAKDSSHFNGDYPVSETGALSLPHLDTPLPVGGLTALQAASAIEAAYVTSGRYEKPKIEVTLKIPAKLSITVGGQVMRPGSQNFTAGMTLEQGVKAAGGIGDNGNPEIAYLYRDGKSSVVDLTDDLDKKRKLKPNDVLEVSFKTSHSTILR